MSIGALALRASRENLLVGAHVVAREKMVQLQWWFAGHEVGPPLGWALARTRQRAYESYEVVVDIPDGKTPDQVAAEFAAGLQRIEDAVLAAKRDQEAMGGQDLHLVWRFEDLAKVGIEPVYELPDNTWRLKMRTRIAITTAQQREAEKCAPEPKVDAEGFEVVAAPYARLYTEEQILDIRTRESKATAISTHAEYTRIPWTGLYVLTNGPLMRWCRRMWLKRWVWKFRHNHQN